MDEHRKSTGPERINFVVGGTQKGGTSALDHYLRLHPQLAMAAAKEPHFFDRERFFAGKTVNISPYHALFDWTRRDLLRGEATPTYMYWWPAARRIWTYNSATKWILLLRNPIERAYSNWTMERQRGAEWLPLLAAIDQERERCRAQRPLQHPNFSYVDRGRYSEQIRRVWHYFGEEQTLILRSEELIHRPQATLDTICDFLGVRRIDGVAAKTVNATSYRRAMSEEEFRHLRSILEPEIMALEAQLGWDCGEWLHQSSGCAAAG